MDVINNLIVGAGPAGLAIAARLRKALIDFVIWESSNQVAYSWSRHYHRLHLHTVKKFSHLPFVDFPQHYPVFVSRSQLLEYFEDYARKFKISPCFGKKLIRAESCAKGWLVADEEGTTSLVKNLIIATGLNSIPKMPAWPGMETFTGEIIHSMDYREASPFRNKRCLVVGMGNTGAEIALDLAENNVKTSISVRSPLNIVPLEAFGRPTQETALRLQKLPRWLQDAVGNLLKKITIGDLSTYGIEISRTAPLKQLLTSGKTPVIDLGTVAMIRKGRIKVKKDIRSFNADQVFFADHTFESYDAVICATGYQSGIGNLLPEIRPLLDPYGNPKFAVGSGRWSGLYFLGFDNFRPGGILGIINQDSELIANHIQQYRAL
jgi:cation diffusion facilitator CzcD-associated flavoprotein CzcO